MGLRGKLIRSRQRVGVTPEIATKTLWRDFLLLVVVVIVIVGYEFLNHPLTDLHVLRTPLDLLIPRVPAFAVPYILLLPIFWGVVLYSFFANRSFRQVAITVIVIHLISYVFYYFFQTYIPRQPVIGSDVFSFLLRLIYAFDQPYNGFPSLHSSLATFVAFYFVWTKSWWSWLVVPYAALVVASTLLVKQHYVPDAISGVALGLATAAVVFMFWPSGREPQSTPPAPQPGQ